MNSPITNKYLSSFLIVSLSLAGVLLSNFPTDAYASNNDKHDEHQAQTHDDEHGDKHDSEEGHIEISLESIRKAGITMGSAKSGEIKQTINVYGKSVTEPSAISQIRARFPGIITKLKLNVGDLIKKGDIVAEVESSDSLKSYTITSPITGVVISRNANPDELANEQALFTIANYDKLWAELKLFPSQTQKVSIGQKVIITFENTQVTSQIKHLLPSNSGKPYIIARVPLDNSQQKLSPGLMLSGSIVTEQTQFSLVVENRAIQVVEDESVIFIQNEKGFETRKLAFGQSDGEFTQVRSGLQLGEQYALENSYLLKADLGKSGASHAH